MSNSICQYEIWKNSEVAQTFLTGVRGAIPLATEQINCLLRIISLTHPEVKNFLDLGCGNGILGGAIHQQYPQARGVFLDFSDTMLQAAANDLTWENCKFIQADFGQQQWVNFLSDEAPFDVIVSGFAIHHQTDERKREIYQEIYDLLTPGGWFLNLEHVASKSELGKEIFNSLFVDSLYGFHLQKGTDKTREEIAQEYYNRDDKSANILAPVEVQCEWLQALGFVDVDCYFKLLEIALFGGRKVINN